MKFYFSVITAGLLVAFAVAGPLFNLNSIGKNYFGILDIYNLVPIVENCSDPKPVSTLEGFVVSDADQNTCSSLPCELDKGKDYGFFYIIGCGAAETSYFLELSIDGGAKIQLSPYETEACVPGQGALISFPYGPPLDAPNELYSYELTLKGMSDDAVHSCIVVPFNVTNGLASRQVH